MGLKQGLEQVVDAARIAAHQQPRLRFVLMGDGNQRATLEAQSSGLPNVSFLGPQPAEWFPEVLHAADVLLVTQRATVTDMSLPSKLTSYLMAARPVVAAVDSASASARFVEQSGAGVVAPPAAPMQLVDAVIRVAGDPVLSARLGSAGRAFAEEHLGAEQSLARAARFVDHLVEGARRSPLARPPRTVVARDA